MLSTENASDNGTTVSVLGDFGLNGIGFCFPGTPLECLAARRIVMTSETYSEGGQKNQ
jgi:hypothetical protein